MSIFFFFFFFDQPSLLEYFAFSLFFSLCLLKFPSTFTLFIVIFLRAWEVERERERERESLWELDLFWIKFSTPFFSFLNNDQLKGSLCIWYITFLFSFFVLDRICVNICLLLYSAKFISNFGVFLFKWISVNFVGVFWLLNFEFFSFLVGWF